MYDFKKELELGLRVTNEFDKRLAQVVQNIKLNKDTLLLLEGVLKILNDIRREYKEVTNKWERECADDYQGEILSMEREYWYEKWFGNE